MKIDCKYNLKDKIKIKPIETLGIIIGFYRGESGDQYQVAYFLDGERKVTYLLPEEICASTKEANLGFKAK